MWSALRPWHRRHPTKERLHSATNWFESLGGISVDSEIYQWWTNPALFFCMFATINHVVRCLYHRCEIILYCMMSNHIILYFMMSNHATSCFKDSYMIWYYNKTKKKSKIKLHYNTVYYIIVHQLYDIIWHYVISSYQTMSY